jgi:hypothetical protein
MTAARAAADAVPGAFFTKTNASYWVVKWPHTRCSPGSSFRPNQFDLQFGPHIAVMNEFQAAVGLYPRQDLSVALRKRLGATLDP